MFTIDGLSTNPILGYDFNQEFSDDLYRVITSRIATFCSEHQLRRHASSGAMEFKKLRRNLSSRIYYGLHQESELVQKVELVNI